MRRGFRQFLNAMAVPRMTEIQPGIHVNIVLKADQRTGKLTSGQVSDILTRGDHPRGIKVRLTDGRIGRVQSLSSASSGANAEPGIVSTQGAAPAAARDIQDDYRLGTEPATTTSLLDYVRVPKQKKGKGGPVAEPIDVMTPQQQLEREFPNLDTALVAAILSDHEFDLPSARATLSSLS
jgi:uncharacterized repeat protein (TIGR03833 family)